MKKLIFFVLLLISIAGRSSAQRPITLTDYRPLNEFGTDTLAYLQNNIPDAEIALLAGGQPLYYYVISVE